MATKSSDYWRDYFKTADSGIFDIIDHAIMVAASDCPKEFRLKRGEIAELLFSCKLSRRSGCDRVELTESRVEDDDGEGFKSKGSEIGEGYRSNFSHEDAEALSDEIEEEREIVGEVLRIKQILQNSQDESVSVLLDSLRRLQLMGLNVDILKATEIGKAVNGMRRHNSKEIRHLGRALIDGWKSIVDEWVKSTQEIAGGTPDSVNPSTCTVEEEEEDEQEQEEEEEEEEEGLPSPPMDEEFLFGNQTMELSELFFDGMDDDCGVRRNRLVAKQDAPKRRQQDLHLPKMNREKMGLLPKTTNMPNSSTRDQSGPPARDSRVPQKPENPMIRRRAAPPPAQVKLCSDEDAVREKLEATKRKLQERYQQAENAKKQRTIQVMELRDLPKQGLVNNKNHHHPKFGNYNNRNSSNARR